MNWREGVVNLSPMAGVGFKGRVVLKVGSSTITGADGFVDHAFIHELAELLAAQRRLGLVPILVSSGAVALGRERMGVSARPKTLRQRQALAAVGQVALMSAWAEAFGQRGVTVAQVLLTRDVVSQREKYLNARATFEELIKNGVLPVVNENDTVAVDELKFGDNDTLSAITAQMVGAQALVLMSDVEGFFTANPRHDTSATLIRQTDVNDVRLDEAAGAEGSDLGSGGMFTKLKAARLAALGGTRTHIIQGKPLGALGTLFAGKPAGTLLTHKSTPKSAKKQWVAMQAEKGRVTINAGAAQSVVQGQKSLLPSGVVAVDGEFERGDAIGIHDEAGVKLASGLSNYSIHDAAKIAGLKSRDIESALGFRLEDELVHRDFLVVLGSGGAGP